MKSWRRIAKAAGKAAGRGGATVLALALCASVATTMAPAGCLVAQAYAAGAASASSKEPSEVPVQIQPGQTVGGYHLSTEEELAEQAADGGIVNMFEKERKTDEELDAEAAANTENGPNGANGRGGADELPSKLDLRDRGVVSPVKNQDLWGTCWAFATNAAVEISLASAIAQKTGETPKALDCSALQTAWFGYTPLPDDASTLSGTAASQAGEGAAPKAGKEKLNLGANVIVPSSCFMQGVGVSWLSETPYQNAEGNRSTSGDWSVAESKRNHSIARLSKMNYLDYLHTTSYTLDQSALKATKAELNAGRGVAVAYRANEPDYMNSDNWCQYIDATDSAHTDTNHVVCIVGYDDSYPASNFNEGHQPPGDGAFIVKNSWGSSSSKGFDWSLWGYENSGYFYLSYYDHSIYRPCSYEFDIDSYTGDNIDTDAEVVDQYDYLQADSISWAVLSNSGADGWYSNVYTASRKESLHDIGTYYLGPGYTLKYRVYKLEDDADSPDDYVSATPAAEGTYTADSEGYVSIKLDERVRVKKGGKYAVWFSQSDAYGACYAPYAGSTGPNSLDNVGWEAMVVINEGESFSTSSLDKAWTQQRNSSFFSYVYDNYCVKAYASVLPAVSDVAFDAQGGSAVAALQGVADGSKIVAPSPAPTRAGYDFGGWYRDAACTRAWDFAADTVQEDTVLYAKWTHIGAGAWKRLAGGSALTTMKAVVNEGWKTSGWAVLATDRSYHDALSASGLAGLLGAPVLLTPRDSLSNVTRNLIKSKKVQDVIVVGGAEAVSDAALAQVAALGVSVRRVAGGTAASTARAVYKEGLRHGGWGSDAVLATSRTYQDALSIAPYAYAKKAPVFLTDLNKTTAGGSTVKLTKKFSRTLVVGGEKAVDASVDAQLAGARRLAGGDCYSTSRKVANFCLSAGMTASHMGVARGDAYQDALCGAALCGRNGSAIVLADDRADKHEENIGKFVARNKDVLERHCYVFGGTEAVSAKVYKAIEAASE